MLCGKIRKLRAQSTTFRSSLTRRNLILFALAWCNLECRNAFESVLFLFFEHPYDVGDMILVKGELMRVKRISLMYTDLVRCVQE